MIQSKNIYTTNSSSMLSKGKNMNYTLRLCILLILAATNNVTDNQLQKKQVNKQQKHVDRQQDDGTQAVQHFDAEESLKSHYQYGGKSLEVDTD